jgi:hypothetical protein
MRNILAQLIEEEELKSMAPGELRAMLAELDDQVVYGEQDAVEVMLPA